MKVGDLVKRKNQSANWFGVLVEITNIPTTDQLSFAKILWNNPYMDPTQPINALEIISESR
jgi:hypothetical protein